MKSVLLSINPSWCKLIQAGEKTLEIRKSAPKLSCPFKVYIYMTKAHGGLGKVIGHFICDEVIPIRVFENGSIQDWNWNSLSRSKVPYDDMSRYIGHNKVGYGWNISELTIYDEPKDLSEFFNFGYLHAKYNSIWYVDDDLWRISRPPQSYMFIENPDDIIAARKETLDGK